MIQHPIIQHANYKEVVENTTRAIHRSRPGGFVWLVGPSGAGKSEVRYEVMRALAGNPKMWMPGTLPAVSVRVALTDRNKFNPKDLAMRLASSLRTPNLSWLKPRGLVKSPDIVHLEESVMASAKDWKALRTSQTEHGFRLEFENTAMVRGVKWVFFEEVASFLKVHKNQDSHNFMVGLMQMAEEIGCVMVLIGTHEAEPLWQRTREVINRSQWVWFHRYDEQSKKDLKPYAQMVKSMGLRFRLKPKDLLLQNLELVLLNGGGVYGPTWSYLIKADEVRESAGSDHLLLEHLQDAAGSESEHIALWNDVRAFDGVARKKSNLELSLVTQSVWAAGNG